MGFTIMKIETSGPTDQKSIKARIRTIGDLKRMLDEFPDSHVIDIRPDVDQEWLPITGAYESTRHSTGEKIVTLTCTTMADTFAAVMAGRI